VVCVSNLKQMGVAFTLYAADNNGTLPPYALGDYSAPPLGTGVFGLIAPYADAGKSSSNSVGIDFLRCPSNKGPRTELLTALTIPLFLVATTFTRVECHE